MSSPCCLKRLPTSPSLPGCCQWLPRSEVAGRVCPAGQAGARPTVVIDAPRLARKSRGRSASPMGTFVPRNAGVAQAVALARQAVAPTTKRRRLGALILCTSACLPGPPISCPRSKPRHCPQRPMASIWGPCARQGQVSLSARIAGSQARPDVLRVCVLLQTGKGGRELCYWEASASGRTGAAAGNVAIRLCPSRRASRPALADPAGDRPKASSAPCSSGHKRHRPSP
jgi:hypothetical protein